VTWEYPDDREAGDPRSYEIHVCNIDSIHSSQAAASQAVSQAASHSGQRQQM
jgi:hypothetical protein